MRARTLLLTAGAASAGVAAAGLAISRRAVRSWSANPDAADGRPAVFPAGLERRVVVDDGASIRTVTTGEGPTIVLVHGLTSCLDDWGYVAERLVAAGFRVVGIDQRGHGRSSVGSAGYGPSRLATDLATVLDVLDVEACVLAGHSMGGMAAQALAIEHPDLLCRRVRSLALVATASSLANRRTDGLLRLSLIGPAQRVAPVLARQPFVVGSWAFGARPSRHLVDLAMASAAAFPEEVRRGATHGLLGFDLTDRLAEIRCPTLVVVGTRDNLTPLAASRVLVQHIPGARLEVLPGAGHLIIWERVAELAALLASFARSAGGQGAPGTTAPGGPAAPLSESEPPATSR